MSTTSKFSDVIKLFSVKFDASRVTDTVKADLRKNITLLEETDKSNFDRVYAAALRSISAGRDLHLLVSALMQMNISGMTKKRAGEIALLLNNKATSLMNKEQEISLGIKYAVWMHSGAPCEMNPKNPTARDVQQNAAHKAANGKEFEIAKGMLLDGKWTWPGVEPGCKCASRVVIPGLT